MFSTSQKIEKLMQFVESLSTSSTGENASEITVIVSVNSNRSKSSQFNIRYPFCSQYPLKNLLRKIREQFQIYHKLQRIFILDTGQELTNYNISTLFNNIKQVHLVVSFGENYIKDVSKSNYYNLYNGNTYPLMDNNTKQEVLSIQIKRNLKQYEYRQTVKEIYNSLHQTCQNDQLPIKTRYDYIDNIDIINAAKQEAQKIFNKLSNLKSPSKKLTNLHFYINTPYFTRKKDSYPMFKFNDKNVINICKCVQIAATKLFQKNIDITQDTKLNRFNIIVREYKYGDFLGFHSDSLIFNENICGIVLKNNYPINGLMLYHYKLKQFMLNENIEGICWMINDCARWEYQHGLYIPSKNEIKGKQNIKNVNDECARISISFRWFNDMNVVPQYDCKNDLKM